MESLWLAQKFFFTGAIYLIAPDSNFQIYFGMLVSFCAVTGTLVMKPYVSNGNFPVG